MIVGPRTSRSGGSAIVLFLGLLLVSWEALSQPQRLLARARAQGTVRVIVSLEEPFTPEGRLSSPTTAQDQRSRISAAQNRLLARMASQGVARQKRFRAIPFVAMEVDAAALTALYSDPEVHDVEEDLPVPLLESTSTWPKSFLPSDGCQDLPASPMDLASSTALIQADVAWSRGYTGNGKVLAILDTGVQGKHPFLSGKVVSEACYSTDDPSISSSSLCPGGVERSTATGSGLNCDPSVRGCDHGTHVAGIAAGAGTAFSGVARNANLVSIQVFSRFDDASICRVSPPCVLSWSSDQILGLERVFALRSTLDIAAVNMSLGGGRYFSTAACDADNTAIKAAIDNLRSVGIATIIASGNNGYIDSMSAPGCISSAVSVGSASFSDQVSFFSNQAPFLSLYAPGEAIQSSIPFNAFGVKSGTSMATPHVAGAWAIMKQRAPAASVAQVLSSLASSGVPITASTGTWSTPRIRLNPALDALSHSQLALEAPADNALVTNPFLVRGWALDRAALTGSGVDAVRVWAFPPAGPPTFLGAATLGFARPDVGALFGAQFDHAGYELTVTTPLLPGSYRLEVSARSAITGTFDVVERRSILMAGPRMAVDSPARGATLSWPIRVSGWAVNLAAPTGTGVDVVHVWAFPAAGGAGSFLGAATLAQSRPDVAAFFNLSRFGSSGFVLESTSILPPGAYMLQVYARSTVTGMFDNYVNIPVSVAAQTRAAIDTPAGGAFLTVPFTVSGWAFSTGSPGAVGIDSVGVQILSASGSPLLQGAATLGIHRPDVASFFGQSALDTSGFRLSVATALADGDYRVRVSIRTTSGTLDTTLESAFHLGSAPRMSLELPGSGATVSAPFIVQGWAVDLAAASGTGIDFVHVWAFPLDGAPGTFLGSATLGISRPDVGTFFSNPRFNVAGFRLQVTSSLSRGAYLLVAYARSSIAGVFNNYRTAVVTVP